MGLPGEQVHVSKTIVYLYLAAAGSGNRAVNQSAWKMTFTQTINGNQWQQWADRHWADIEKACSQSVKCDQKIKEEAAKKASPKNNDNAGEVSMKKLIHTMIHRQQQQSVLMKVKATAASCALCKCWPVWTWCVLRWKTATAPDRVW